MADDKDEYGDEYQFADLDVISPDSSDEEEGSSEAASQAKNSLMAAAEKILDEMH
ncbi:hypothetical protein [Legionella tunisiensis]|uniref:hypothetical protein n=1 Tax=Legionella tunisiensis TaxID=1034944 RepID=UPI0002F5BE55|nr:hypothetical protein [Legionella tunisiensis]